MMNTPNCPQHRDMVLELALGRLDDDAALVADEARLSCDHCSAWWEARFASAEVELIEQAVTEALTSVDLPSRQHRQPWLAVAAAAVIVFAASTLWLEHRAPSNQVNQANQAAAMAPEIIAVDQVSTLDFETGQAVATMLGDDALVTASFESGDLEIGQRNDNPQMLTALSFESGDLSGLVPAI